MRKRRGQSLPHLFNEVLDAIALLKESKGSSEKSILKQVDTILHMRRQHLKKSIGSIHRALRHGLKTGLLKLKNGKYCLGMSAADFRLYRKVQRLRSTDNLYKEFRTNRKRGGKGKRRGKRRKSISSDEKEDSEDESEVTSYSPSSAGSSQFQDRGRRRGGRRRGKGRRRRRSKRRRRAVEIVQPDNNDEQNKPEIISQKSSDGSIKTTNTNYETTNVEASKTPPTSSKYENNDDNQTENTDRTRTPVTEQKCDNPECLCNSQKSFHDRKSYD